MNKKRLTQLEIKLEKIMAECTFPLDNQKALKKIVSIIREEKTVPLFGSKYRKRICTKCNYELCERDSYYIKCGY